MRKLSIFASLSLLSTPAFAQSGAVPPPDAPPAAPAGTIGSSPAASYLASQYNLSLEEATRRAQLQDAIADLVAQVN